MSHIPPNEIIARRIRMSCVGQSNERAAGQFADVGKFGAPFADNPIENTPGTWWPKCFDDVWTNSKYWIDLKNTAVGATGIVRHWCGDTSGVGTGTPFASGDGGYDPNGYIQDAIDAATDSLATHEPWCYISLGQEDSLTTNLANYQLGLQNVIDDLLANNIKVMLGFTCYRPASEVWYDTAGNVAIQNLWTIYAGSTVVKQGANLFTDLGKGITFYDGTHMTRESYDLAAVAVATAIKNNL